MKNGRLKKTEFFKTEKWKSIDGIFFPFPFPQPVHLFGTLEYWRILMCLFEIWSGEIKEIKMKSVQLLLMFLFIVLAKSCPSSKNEETSTKKNEDIIEGKFVLKSGNFDPFSW